MAKRKARQKSAPRRSKKSAGRSHKQKNSKRRSKRPSFVSLLLFWPLHLWHRLTRGLPFLVRWPLRIAGDVALLGLMVAVVLGIFYHMRAKHFDLEKVAEMPERTIILDRNDREIGRIHGEKRDIVGLNDVALPFRMAILAREDERFESHGGVDLLGIGRAILRNLKDTEFTQGASTITMQLSRNTYPLYSKALDWAPPLRELDRKFLEMALTYRIEGYYSKDEILEHYVNRIFWGHSIMGIEEASRTYFEKHARDLTLSEAALLAGIVRGPNAFSPFNDVAKARRERDTTLDRMVDAEFITPEEAALAKEDPITVRPEWRRVIHENYAMDAIRRDLEQLLEEENIELGGLTIRTTIDSRIQIAAEKALDNKLREVERSNRYPHQTRAAWNRLPAEQRNRPSYIQGAAVVIENRTGAVLAVVGGRDADESKFNRAIQAKRQLGSIFKPFVYLAAFDNGMRPDTWISDNPLRPGEIKGAQRSWSPKNSDGTFQGVKPASYGLVRSRNTMSVRVGNYAGIKEVQGVAKAAGFDAVVPSTPASYLGAWEATPWEVASAYTIFPNKGNRYRPYLIDEIRTTKGDLIWKTPPLPYRAARTGLGLVGLPDPRGCHRQRHRRPRRLPRIHQALRRQDRHHRQLQGCLVRRLHVLAELRGLGRARPAAPHHRPRLRIDPRAAGLDRDHENLGTPRLPGQRPRRGLPVHHLRTLPLLRQARHRRLPR
jgi:penicillin-binding protein 1A